MVGSSLLQFWVVPPVIFILDGRARDLGPAGHRDGRREGGGGGGAGREGGVGGVGVWRGRSVAGHLLSHLAARVSGVLQLPPVSVVPRGGQVVAVLQRLTGAPGVAGE